MKFLTKQEIVDKLNTLPNLPVVIAKDDDYHSSTGIEHIEVRECVRGYSYENQNEYYSHLSKDDEGKPIEKVIWIS